MTQYDSPMDYGMQQDRPLRTSGIAIASLVCSLIFCCPLTTIIGPILGLIGLLTIDAGKGTKGKGLCLAGIILGVIFTVGWGVLLNEGYGLAKEMERQVREGPAPALEAGYDGNYADFQDDFFGPGTAADPQAAENFIEELRTRYGDFTGVSMQQQPAPFGQQTVVFRYDLQFSNATVPADVELMFGDQQTGNPFVVKLLSIDIVDDELGNLRYPPMGQTAEQAPGEEEPAAEEDTGQQTPGDDAGGEG
jgi:hypothetical protein